MKKEKSLTAQTLFLTLLTTMSLPGLASCQDNNYEKLVESCKQIQLGMPEDQVLQKMGPPAKVETVDRNGQKLKILMYPAPALAAMPPDVYIDMQSQQVQKVFCDDRYQLIAPASK